MRGLLRSSTRGSGLLAALVCLGCSSPPTPAPQPSSRPQSATAGGGPSTAFPDSDTPLAGVSSTRREYWRPYQVVIVPGRQTTASIPAPPRAVNDTVIPDVIAQRFAQAFYRAQAWRRWGTRNAQADFLRHLGQDPFDVRAALLNGSQVQVPDCAVFPTSIVVASVAGLDIRAPGDQYALEVTYSGPCQVQSVAVDGRVDQAQAFQDSATFLSVGWLQSDPLLGEIWSPDQVVNCYRQVGRVCPVPVVESQPVAALPALLDTDTPVDQASAALQNAWRPYDVLDIPGRAVVAGLPEPPTVDNATDGEVPDPLAQRWALAVVRDQAWWRWSWQAVQLAFGRHLGDSSRDSGNTLASATQRGGRPVLPDCATYPASLELHALTADEAARAATAVLRVQFAFTATWATPCSVAARFPDGSINAVTTRTTLTLYGQLRLDPLLGEVWYPLYAGPPIS